MDTAAHALAPHSSDSLRVVPSAQTLLASAVYQLSENGRKTSLLAGGDGKAVQRLTVQVPARGAGQAEAPTALRARRRPGAAP